MLRGSAYGIIPLNIINAVQISWGGFRDEISWGGFRDELTNNISLSLSMYIITHTLYTHIYNIFVGSIHITHTCVYIIYY